jgi:hypothetical protein
MVCEANDSSNSGDLSPRPVGARGDRKKKKWLASELRVPLLDLEGAAVGGLMTVAPRRVDEVQKITPATRPCFSSSSCTRHTRGSGCPLGLRNRASREAETVRSVHRSQHSIHSLTRKGRREGEVSQARRGREVRPPRLGCSWR